MFRTNAFQILTIFETNVGALTRLNGVDRMFVGDNGARTEYWRAASFRTGMVGSRRAGLHLHFYYTVDVCDVICMWRNQRTD